MRLPFEVRLLNSPRLAGALAALHGAAMFCVLFAAWISGTWAIALVGVAVAASFLKHFGRRDAEARASALRVDAEGRFALRRNGSEWLLREFVSASLPLPGLIVLRLNDDQNRLRTLVIGADQMSADDFRRLRQLVRWPPASRANDAPA